MALTRFLTIEATAAAQNTEADAEDPLVGIPRNSTTPVVDVKKASNL